MRIVVVSDTHMLHRRLAIPGGDVLVHCGDWSQDDSVADYDDFFGWYGALPHTHKLLTAGNHESLMRDFESLLCPRIPKNVTYLRDDGVTLDGLRFWASPYSMALSSMAFTFKRIGDARRHWARIPADTEVLVTHGPPYGILDESASGQNIGDPMLYQRVEALRPRLHLFGHVHGCGGRSMERFGTTFVNAAVGDDPTADLDARIQVIDLS